MVLYCLYWLYNSQGKMMVGKIGEWRFDKRSYGDKPPPRNLTLPPRGVPESVVYIYSFKQNFSHLFPFGFLAQS